MAGMGALRGLNFSPQVAALENENNAGAYSGIRDHQGHSQQRSFWVVCFPSSCMGNPADCGHRFQTGSKRFF